MTTDPDSEARELADRMLHDSSNHSWAKRTELLAQALRKAEARGLRGAFEIHVKYPPDEAERVMLEAIEELERGRT